MEYRVNLCETAPQTVLRIPLEIRPARLAEGIAGGMRQVAEIAQRAGLTASGAPTMTFHHELPVGDTVTVDFGLPIEPAPNLGPSSGAELTVQAPMLVARTSHRGGYGGLDAAYQALRDWLREAGCRPIGPPTEAYLIGPDEVNDPRRLITEIRIPVAPAPAMVARLDPPFATALRLVRLTLEHYGFEILAGLNVQATVRERAGEHIDDHMVLTVCDPGLVARTLAADPQAGLVLCTSVVVRADEAGVLVEAADPEVLAGPLHQPRLAEVAAEARRRLATVLETLRHRTTTVP